MDPDERRRREEADEQELREGRAALLAAAIAMALILGVITAWTLHLIGWWPW